MRVVRLAAKSFRSYEAAQLQLDDGITVLIGENGSGKTNLLEALYFGCTGRSCRTTNEREVVRFGASTARVVVEVLDEDGHHELTVGFSPGQPKRIAVDGASVERLLDSPHRPLVSVFLPDRLELVKGAPGVRRAHLDQFISALWPTRSGNRRAYAQVLAQRNALIGRIRGFGQGREQLEAWDRQLARHALAVMADRREALELLGESFSAIASELGIGAPAELAYRPRSRASSEDELVAELGERHEGDLDRGYTGHGPHRDELAFLRDGRELRAYGSQGQQRVGLLSLLLAERRVLAGSRGSVPLMLLDDVMSELDQGRRQNLIGLLRADGGQSLLTATEADHVPGVASARLVEVSPGRLLVAEPAR